MSKDTVNKGFIQGVAYVCAELTRQAEVIVNEHRTIT